MRKIIYGLFLILILGACDKLTDDEPKLEPLPEAPERYFTITNEDEKYSFLTYDKQYVIGPNEVTKPLTLKGNSADYIIFWIIDKQEKPETLHINMGNEPEGVTINYTVKYE